MASWVVPSVVDDLDPTPTVIASHTQTDPFPIGRTVVEYTARDNGDNLATPCSFSITVQGKSNILQDIQIK